MSPYCCKNNSKDGHERWSYSFLCPYRVPGSAVRHSWKSEEEVSCLWAGLLSTNVMYRLLSRPLLILWLHWIVVDMFQNLIDFLIYEILMTLPKAHLTKILRWSWDWSWELGQIWSKIIRFQNQNCSKVSMAESVSVTDQLELAIWNHGPGLQDLPMYEQLHCGLRVYLHRCQRLGKASMFASTPGGFHWFIPISFWPNISSDTSVDALNEFETHLKSSTPVSTLKLGPNIG